MLGLFYQLDSDLLFSTLKKKRGITKIGRICSQTAHLPDLVDIKLILSLQGNFGDGGRNGTEEEGKMTSAMVRAFIQAVGRPG